MRILVLSSATPYPPHGGGYARMYAILRHLARDHAVDLLALARPADLAHRGALERVCRRVHLLPAPTPPAGLRRWAAALKHLVRLQAYPVDPGIARRVEGILQDGYDVIQVENVYMMPYVRRVRDAARALDIFGLGSAGLWRDVRAATGPVAVLRAAVTRLKAKRVERSLRSRFDAVYVVSEQDRAYLTSVDPRLPVHVVPNGVDTRHFAPAPEPTQPPVDLVFTGAMDYTANEDAVLFFHRAIYPRIRDRLGEARFWVVGRDPGPRLAALAADPTITVTGEVEDVRPYLARATVVVAPIRLGAGTRIKILEALAMAKAVVATPAAAEGLRLVPGEELVVAAAPEAFADAGVRLAGDAAARQRLGRAGRARVEAEYDWEITLAPLTRAVAGLAGRRPSDTWAR